MSSITTENKCINSDKESEYLNLLGKEYNSHKEESVDFGLKFQRKAQVPSLIPHYQLINFDVTQAGRPTGGILYGNRDKTPIKKGAPLYLLSGLEGLETLVKKYPKELELNLNSDESDTKTTDEQEIDNEKEPSPDNSNELEEKIEVNQTVSKELSKETETVFDMRTVLDNTTVFKDQVYNIDGAYFNEKMAHLRPENESKRDREKTIDEKDADMMGVLIIGGDGNDTIVGTEGDDTIVGGAGDDLIISGSGDDIIYGDNIIVEGIGLDLIIGRSGDDIIYGDNSDSFDEFSYSKTDLVPTDVLANTEPVETTPEDGGEDISYDDTIYGGTGSDTIYGGIGDDVIYGGGSNEVPGDEADLIYGEEGDDLLFGNGGNDTVSGGSGSDTVWGGLGDDIIYGGDSNEDPNDEADLIYGNEGYDTIFGNGGNDTIHGGSESDTVWGGLGNDIIYGGEGNDVFYGNKGNDTLYGNEGYDTIYGGEGNDVLYGNEGKDVLYGNDGADSLDGGAGQDTLYGGEGDDTFIFSNISHSNRGSLSDIDIIKDFTSGDKIDLSGIESIDEFIDLNFSKYGENYTLVEDINSEFSIALYQIDFQLMEDDFIFN